jgi:hypothetical protein
MESTELVFWRRDNEKLYIFTYEQNAWQVEHLTNSVSKRRRQVHINIIDLRLHSKRS